MDFKNDVLEPVVGKTYEYGTFGSILTPEFDMSGTTHLVRVVSVDGPEWYSKFFGKTYDGLDMAISEMVFRGEKHEWKTFRIDVSSDGHELLLDVVHQDGTKCRIALALTSPWTEHVERNIHDSVRVAENWSYYPGDKLHDVISHISDIAGNTVISSWTLPIDTPKCLMEDLIPYNGADIVCDDFGERFADGFWRIADGLEYNSVGFVRSRFNGDYVFAFFVRHHGGRTWFKVNCEKPIVDMWID